MEPPPTAITPTLLLPPLTPAAATLLPQDTTAMAVQATNSLQDQATTLVTKGQAITLIRPLDLLPTHIRLLDPATIAIRPLDLLTTTTRLPDLATTAIKPLDRAITPIPRGTLMVSSLPNVSTKELTDTVRVPPSALCHPGLRSTLRCNSEVGTTS